MKKIIALLLMLGLVLGMGSVVMAQDSASDSVDVDVTVAEYYDVEFATPEYYKGLFDLDGVDAIAEAGIYISNGDATKDYALEFWDEAGASEGDIIDNFFDSGRLSSPKTALFKVDANTNVDVTLEVNWENWMNAPTFFRVSSCADYTYDHPETGEEVRFNGIGNWSDYLAVVGNTVNQVANHAFKDIMTEHNDAVGEATDTFPLKFRDEYICHGPLDFHVNAALWLPKISQVAADDYSAEVTVTVAASNTN